MSYNRLKSLAANVAAIETAVTVHKQRRKATQEEKQVLAQYSGFGGVKEVLTIGTQIPMPEELAEQTNYFLPDMRSIAPDTVFINEVSQTHLIAPEKVIYIDYGDTCINVSKAENTENIIRMIARSGRVQQFPKQTNVSFATESGRFFTFNVDYREKPEAFVYEVGEKKPEKKANVILTDNIIPAGERDDVMNRVYNAKRQIYNKGIVRNKIVFSLNNLHIYDNLLLFTFEIENKSRLPYDIDYIRYYIVDRKTAKLTASQEVDQQALFSENYSPRIEGNGRRKLCSTHRGQRQNEVCDCV